MVFMMQPRPKLITVVGPTAVGKTDVTLRLAKAYKAPVISGDAYQVYRHFDIGTAKPTADEMAAVKHYLIDILDGDEPYSVSLFQEQASTIIKKYNDKHIVPIVSGGTGLYVQALLEGYHFSHEKPNELLRQELDRLYDSAGIEGLRRKAQVLANGRDIPYLQDKHRLYRAIELMEAGDFETLVNQTKDGLSYDGVVIGLQRDRRDLYERINRRVLIMFDKGLVDEIRHLLAMGIPRDSQAFKGIGYKEVLDYIDGLVDLDTCIAQVQQNTRRFAKRQITWYKRMPYIEWITVSPDMTDDDVYLEARKLLEQHQL